MCFVAPPSLIAISIPLEKTTQSVAKFTWGWSLVPTHAINLICHSFFMLFGLEVCLEDLFGGANFLTHWTMKLCDILKWRRP
jgi:hypothetical protein